jgi:iron-sulfur cluster repair protein YtfE (RIC family)
MQGIEAWLFPATPVATVLRKRPGSIALLEKHGMDPYDPALPTIGILCSNGNISWEAFAAGLQSLPEPGPETDWKNQPVFLLLDYLTREHRRFIGEILPSILSALSRQMTGNADSLRRLRYMAEEWPGFSVGLQEHIQEEEEFLFPKLLRYDYGLRHQNRHPDFTDGSVTVYVALQMLRDEKKQMTFIRRFLNEVLFTHAVADSSFSPEARLEPLLEDLQFRLLGHSSLETNVLFPWAKAAEKASLDGMIAGNGTAIAVSHSAMPE